MVALGGAEMKARLDEETFSLGWDILVHAGQQLIIGKAIEGGCRSYPALYDGFPITVEWYGCKSTAPMTGVGGCQERALASGDFLGLMADLPKIHG